MVQVTYNHTLGRERIEFFAAETTAEARAKMDARLGELKAGGETFVRRSRIGRNTTCPCGSGRKFKKCCIDKAR